MSILALLVEAVSAALRGDAWIAAGVSTVFDAPPVRAALPYALVEQPVLADWGTKDMAGREGRIAVLLFDGGERPVRLRELAAAAESAIAAMPRELGEGWRIASMVLTRTRIRPDGASRWAATSEWRVRMLREG